MNPDIRAWARECSDRLFELEDLLYQIQRKGEVTEAFKEARRKLTALLHQDEVIISQQKESG